MDMNTPVSPLILQSFYTILIIEFIFLLMVSSVGWFIGRRVLRFRALFQSQLDLSMKSVVEASRHMRIRKWVTITFGLMWVLDGLLQAQPEMSNQFISGLEVPLLSGLPGFLPSVLSPLLYSWTLHPFMYNSLAVWFQILLGVGILFGPTRRVGRFALYSSIAWSAVIWVVGEGFGGILTSASWLTGGPGAVLLYSLAAVLLIQPAQYWTNGTVSKWLDRSIGVLWLACAVLQALPSAGFWESGGLQGAELSMAQMSQPSWMATPLFTVAQAFTHDPVLWNAAFVVILLSLSVLWLIRPSFPGLAIFTAGFTFLTWWIGQDFGVIGGMGTDLNTGGPLLVLVIASIALHRTAEESVAAISEIRETRSVLKPVSLSIGIAIVTMTVGSVAGYSAAARDSSSAIQAALSNSGLTPVNIPLPNITLTDQNGKSVSLSDFRGKAVLLTFLDPVCYAECPIIAREMLQADKLLGPYGDKVQMVAIVANPIFHSVADVQRFDKQEGMDTMSNWTFLTSNNLAVLQDTWHKLYEYVAVPRLGMVDHAESMYFVSPNGSEIWLAQMTGDTSSSTSYSAFLATYAEKLLGVSEPLNGNQGVTSKTYDSELSHPPGFDSIHMETANAGWAAAFVDPYEEVLRTTNGGRHWTNVTPQGISQRGGLLVAPISSTDAWVLLPQYGYTAYATLFHTTNGGFSWSRVGYPGPTPTMYGSNALSANPDGTLWLTGAAHEAGTVYLYRSANQAKTWTTVRLSLPGSESHSVTTGPITWTSQTDGELAAKFDEGVQQSVTVFSTYDGGRTWTPSSTQVVPTNATASKVLVEGRPLTFTAAGSSGSVVLLQDTRTPVGTLESNIGFVDVLDRNLLWGIRTIHGNTQLVRSKDRGKTWTAVFSDNQLPKNTTS